MGMEPRSSFITRLSFPAVALCLLLGSGPSAMYGIDTQGPDEHQVTVLKRDGSRASGLLEGVDANGIVYVRTSLAEQHKIPLSEVVVIDFVDGASGLPETETAPARGKEHVMVLRDSSIVKGRFIETRGGKGSGDDGPRIVYFQPSGAPKAQEYAADRVGRIYLGNYPSSSAASAETRPASAPAGAIHVPANQDWTPTPVRVREGERLRFQVDGEIGLSDAEGDVAGAAGSMKGRKAANAPLAENPVGCLIARIGNSAPFAIGNTEAPMTMPATGQLFLGINDDHVADNRGEFAVSISRAARSR
jgi:hypothetical protein